MGGLRIERVGYALGARVNGVNVCEVKDAAAVAEIRALWLEHMLLCFPDQQLTVTDVERFAGQFGALEFVGTPNTDEKTPHVGLLSNKPVNGKPITPFKDGQFWHTDKIFTSLPTSGTFLYAAEIPKVGGDTNFANMYMAYETLSPKMQELAGTLCAIHDDSYVVRRDMFRAQGVLEAVETWAQSRTAKFNPTVQPVVRVHAETGRKALYLSERITRFAGMTEEESKPILEFLIAHATRYEFTYRHRWAPHDLVMFDNRCMMHLAIADYDLQHDVRHMIRGAVSGEPCGHDYTPADDERVLLPLV